MGKNQCEAKLWHGPGHQSRARCQRVGEHTIHMCTYGRHDQEARWRGDEAFTGYFNEPPWVSHEEYEAELYKDEPWFKEGG